MSQQLVIFSLGNEEYALPIEQVHEIIRYTQPRSVVSDIPWVRGVINLRGKIVPVYDLAQRLSLDGERADQAKIVIIESGSDMAGVIVDDVTEVLNVELEQLEEAPAAETDSIEAIAKIDDRLVVLLNTQGIFAGSDVQTVAAAA